MVSDDRRLGERAQLVLLGGVVLATLIIGLVVVFNSVLFTEHVDRGGAAESGQDATAFVAETRGAPRGRATRPTPGGRFEAAADAGTAMAENVSQLSAALAEAYADSAAAYANVSFAPGDSEFGYRVLQGTEGELVEPGGGPSPDADWDLVGDETAVGWLVLNLNASTIPTGEPFAVVFENDTGERMRLTFSKDGSGYVQVGANFTATPGANETVDVVPGSDRVLSDVLDGSVYGRDVAVNATEHLDPPYGTVRFENGDELLGTYELVTEDDELHGGFARNRVVWSANVSVTYQGATVDYDRSWDLEVYNATA
jgi:hypothetical protein